MRVGVVVPARRLDLDVFADAVEAHRLCLADVPPQRGVGRCRVQPVREEALVQGHVGKGRAAVEQDLRDAVDQTGADGPLAEVGADDVLGPSSPQGGTRLVEERVVRAPQSRLGQRDVERVIGRPAAPGHDPVAVLDRHLDRTRRRTRAVDQHGDRGAGGARRVRQFRGEGHLVDALGRSGLQPHRLPDAARRGVEDAGRVQALFALRLGRTAGVLHARRQLAARRDRAARR